MSKFETEYKKLNPGQKKAVDITEGPMLVMAGPGTGKTQLLSMRVANILHKNDILPGNILCLTFTDNAARNMRERLSSIIGQPAYHVAIHTFHSFGVDVINQYPDYFIRRQLLQQIDELGRYELLGNVFEELPHSNPLSAKVGDNFINLKPALNIISWLKQNALIPEELHEILNDNKKFTDNTSAELAEVFSQTPSPKQLAIYNKFLKKIESLVGGKKLFGFAGYAKGCALELKTAIEQTDSSGRFAPKITEWRNSWCKKDASSQYVWKDGGQNYRKMHAIGNVYRMMLDNMSAQGLYDFDDMVIEAVHAMENNDELRYNLQERYQYILVDEFQDTNKAQLRMLAALGDNPVHENKPNIMAVGDDNQAIYAFQGAEVSNMAVFAKMYDEPKLIALEDNYRSSEPILKTGEAVAEQITDRLDSVVKGAHKNLIAKQKYKTGVLDRLTFNSELSQYDWLSKEIKKSLKNGIKPEKIAVIAPRHKYLERLMPYLGSEKLPVAYERRENILEAPLILQLLTMSELVVAIAENNQDAVDNLFSQVLGYDFWGISNEQLIKLSLECYNEHLHWLPVLNSQKDKNLKQITRWFVRLAKRSRLEPMEYMLDQLLGAAKKGTDSEYDDLLLPEAKDNKFISPMRQYYFNSKRYEQATDTYLALLGQLSTLRHRLRLWKPNRTIYIKDLIEFTRLHQAANLKIVDTNPHTQTTSAVQVMTAYKAKGLEFDIVFVINAQDEVWGPTARTQTARISLPKNLPIEPAGQGDNDKLRLLFVAMTRAKHTLHITGYSHTMENKLSPSLSFLEDNGLEEKIIDRPAPPDALEILSTDFTYRFRQVIADKKALFEPILVNYKLSVTHLNNFIDVSGGGPDYFLVHNLLRFPQALTPSAAYGDAVHKTLQWVHLELKTTAKLPRTAKVENYFVDMLSRSHLKSSEYKKMDKRGREALKLYLKEKGKNLSGQDMLERSFNNEGVAISQARLSGKVDKIHFTDKNTLEVTDFKTGKPAKGWKGKDEYEKIKLHKYRRQLLFYKLLIENSASFSGRQTVSRGMLEFIEPDENGRLTNSLGLQFDVKELADFSRLIKTVWDHIMDLNFPDISKYPKNLSGIKQFEKDLVDGKI